MASEVPILTDATITEEVESGRLYRADLPNGKSVAAHISAKKSGERAFAPGDVVTLEMTPFDFSKGRIKI